MSDRVLIRKMRAGEEPEVCALVARGFDDYVAPGFSPEGVAEFRRFAEPGAMAERGKTSGTVLVAEEDGRIVGMLELRGFDHIALFFVEASGRGIGRRLFEEALGLCRVSAPGCREVTVHSSRNAVPIYRRLGFELEGPLRTENGIIYLPMRFPLRDDR